MSGNDGPSRDELLAEITRLRARNAELEEAEAKRKAAARRIRRQEALLRAILTNLPFDFWARDPKGRVIMQSDASVANWGDLKDMPFAAKDVFPETLDVWSQNNARAIAGETLREDQNLILNDGRRGVFHSIIAPIRQEGEILGILGVNIDLGERIAAERALRESESRFRALFEDSPISLWVEDLSGVAKYFEELRASGAHDFEAHFDAHPEALARCLELTRVVDMNRSTLRLFGASSKEELLSSLDRLIPESEYLQIKKEYLALANGASFYSGEIENVTLNGERKRFAVQFNVAPGYEKTMDLVIVSLMDLTERDLAQAALLENERRFRSLFDAVESIAVQGYDKDRKVIYWNAASETLYGYSAAEALGRPLEELIIPPPMRAAVVENVRRWVEEGVPIPSGELSLMRKDQTLTPVLSSHIMQKNASGDHEMFCLDIDLTELKRVERDLIRARDLAEAANVAKNEFLASMSHEVRTPLNGVMAMLQLLQTTGLSGEQRSYVDISLSSSRTLLRLLSDILDISRIEAGTVAFESAPFDLAEAVRAVARDVSADAAQKGLAIECVIHPDAPDMVLGDPLRIRQALLNLAGNAVKFTDKGRVRIELSRLSPNGEDKVVRALLAVSDTGIGISDEAMGRIFLSFTQEDGSIARKYGGAGLGLAIVSRLARMMGGGLCASSEPGVGSEFCLSLRLGLPDAKRLKASRPVASQPASSSRKPRVLVVEDDPINQLAALTILRKLGYPARSASGGLQALEMLERETFDMALMDVQMPGMDGLETVRRIRESGKPYANMPIIAMTAHAMSGDKERFLASGMDGYASKPVDMDALAQALLEAAPKRRS